MTQGMRALLFALTLCLGAAYGQISAPASPTAATDAAPAPQEARVEPPSVPYVLEPPSLQDISPELIQGLEIYWRPEAVPEPGIVALTLEDSVRIALEQNPQVLMAQDQIDQALARIGQAQSQMFPQVSADSSYVRIEPEGGGGLGGLGGLAGGGALGGLLGGLSAPLQIIGGLLEPCGPDITDIGQGLFSLLFPVNIETPKYWRRDHIGGTQVLYAGGQIRAAIKASKYLAESQEWRKSAVINGLVFQTKQAYYNALLTRALIRVAQESVTTFERHLADTQQMLDVGLVSNFELLRAQTELNARQSDLITAYNAERLALANLRRILGINQDAPILLVSDLDLRPVEESPEALIDEAMGRRPELVSLDKGIESSQQNIRRVKGQYKPRVVGNVDYVHVDGRNAPIQEGWTFTGAAQYDIVTGGRRKYETVEARAQLSNLEHQKVDVTRMVQLDVQQAYIQLEDSLAKIRADRGTVELAREGRRLAELRFQEGVGTQVEVLDAELALTRAETKLVQDFRDYATARAGLDQAVGRNVPAPPEGATLEVK